MSKSKRKDLEKLHLKTTFLISILYFIYNILALRNKIKKYNLY